MRWLLTIFLLTQSALAQQQLWLTSEGTTSSGPTNYFYWLPTNEVVQFNGATAIDYPTYLATVDDRTNHTVRCEAGSLTFFSATNLTTFREITLNDNASMAEIYLPNLKYLDNINLDGTALTNLNLAALLIMTNKLEMQSCGSLHTVDAPLVTYIRALDLSFDDLYRIMWPALLTNVEFIVANNTSLTNVALDAALALGHMEVTGGTVLTNVYVGSATFSETNNAVVAFTGGALPVGPVNHILARVIADSPTGDTVDLTGGTIATPTGQGFTDYQSLTNAGNIVNINP